MANLGQIVYISEQDKETLFETGTVTVIKDGVPITINYSGSDLYVTPDSSSPKQETFSDGETVTTTDNTEYRASGDISTLNLVFGTTTMGVWIKFKTADSGDITITLPQSAQFIGSKPVFEKGKTYELSVKDGLVAWGVSA